MYLKHAHKRVDVTAVKKSPLIIQIVKAINSTVLLYYYYYCTIQTTSTVIIHLYSITQSRGKNRDRGKKYQKENGVGERISREGRDREKNVQTPARRRCQRVAETIYHFHSFHC